VKEPWKNQNSPNNSKKYHTGKPCVEVGCKNPAGTAWSPYFCKECNAARFERIDASFKKITSKENV